MMNVQNPWTVYRTRFLVRARRLTEPLAFTDALGREQSGLPGDYLVEFSEGVLHITPRAIFEDIYVPLEASLPEARVASCRVAPAHGDSGTLSRPAHRYSPQEPRAAQMWSG